MGFSFMIWAWFGICTCFWHTNRLFYQCKLNENALNSSVNTLLHLFFTRCTFKTNIYFCSNKNRIEKTNQKNHCMYDGEMPFNDIRQITFAAQQTHTDGTAKHRGQCVLRHTSLTKKCMHRIEYWRFTTNLCLFLNSI